MFGFLRRRKERAEMGEKINWIASAEDEAEVVRRAEYVARETPPSLLDHVPSLVNDTRNAPERFSGFLEWRDARYEAIYELMLAFGADSLPTLRQFARGPSNWPQGHMINALCQLAGEEIPIRTVEQIVLANFYQWRWETVLRAASGLSRLASLSEPTAQAFLTFIDSFSAEGAPQETLVFLLPLAANAPRVAARRQTVLLALMRRAHENRADAIQAGLALHWIDPAQTEVRQFLERCGEEHPDPQTRTMIREELNPPELAGTNLR